MTNENYVRMCMKILTNTKWYRKVDLDYLNICTTKFTELVVQTLYNDLINKDTMDFLLIKHPKVPTF